MKLNENFCAKSTIRVIFLISMVIIFAFLPNYSFSAQGIGTGGTAQPQKQVEKFLVSVEKPVNGSIKINPPLPEDGKVDAGTIITISATPDKDYSVDSCYYFNAASGLFGRVNVESMSPEFKITIDQNKTVGASFIENKALEGFKVIQDVVYAQPGVKKLKYDVYSPNGAGSLPCIVIIHGGAWIANNEDIARGLARELVRSGKYVVCSIDFRWLGILDGDSMPNTMVDVIEDVFGAIAHIQEHAREYGADPTRIAVTGDSSGAHLSAVAINMINLIGDGGFAIKENVFQYRPTYMPANKTIEQVRKELTNAIKAAAPSYGGFDIMSLKVFAPTYPDLWFKALSPINNIPNIKDRAVPQFMLRGTNDSYVNNETVQAYADALKAAGQPVEYIQIDGANHGFFSWQPDAASKAAFAKYGVPCAAKIKDFFDTIFYPKK
jgi:acetyl esterase